MGSSFDSIFAFFSLWMPGSWLFHSFFLVSVWEYYFFFFNFSLILAGPSINVVSTSTHSVSFSGQFRNSMKDFWPLNGSLGVRMYESIYIYMKVNLFSFRVFTINVNEIHGICTRRFVRWILMLLIHCSVHPSCIRRAVPCLFLSECLFPFLHLFRYGWSHSHKIARESATSRPIST